LDRGNGERGKGGKRERIVTETASDSTVTCTQRKTNGVYGLDSAKHGAGYQAEMRKRAGRRKLVVDWPPEVQKRRKFVPLVFESSGYVAKLARLHIKQWAHRTRRGQGVAEEEGSVMTITQVPVRDTSHRLRCTIGTTLSYMCGTRFWTALVHVHYVGNPQLSCSLPSRGWTHAHNHSA
jgi:hypothetical protein